MATKRELMLNLFESIAGESNYNKLKSTSDQIKAMNFQTDVLGIMQQALILQKLKFGMQLAKTYGSIIVVVEMEELEELERRYKVGLNGTKTKATKKKPAKKKATKFKKPQQQIGKYTDQGTAKGKGMQDIYWEKNGMELLFDPKDTTNRKGFPLPGDFRVNNERYLMQLFNLDAIEYGHWLNQQDRANYLGGVALSMLDLAGVLGFDKKQIGFGGKLSIGLGARGRGKARAHFSPAQFFINLTRFARPSKFATNSKNAPERNKLFFLAGGANAFAHEFGHALDYYLGTSVLKQKGHVTGQIVSTDFDTQLIKQKTIPGIIHKILFQIIWNKYKQDHTEYYKKIRDHDEYKYLCKRTELFARLFEQYVCFKLNAKNYYNLFLTEKQYNNMFYLPAALLKKVLPDIDALMVLAKKVVPR
jgi:hypothetical protein